MTILKIIGIILITLVILIIIIKFVLSYIMFNYCFKGITQKKNKKYDDIYEKKLPSLKEYKEELLKKPFERLEMTSSRNHKLYAYYLKQQPNNKKLIIMSHGWLGDAFRDSFYFGPFYFNHQDFDVLLVAHEGHYPSEGKYIGFSIYDGENLKKWIDYINKTTDNNYQIYLHGVSMGASSVLRTLNYDLPNVKGVIADCGFSSGYEELCFVSKYKYHTPSFYTVPYIRRIILHRMHYDIKEQTIDINKKHNIPVLFIHGALDDFVPCKMSEKNYERYNGPKKIIIFPNAKHASSYRKNKEEYEKLVMDFIEKSCI